MQENISSEHLKSWNQKKDLPFRVHLLKNGNCFNSNACNHFDGHATQIKGKYEPPNLLGDGKPQNAVCTVRKLTYENCYSTHPIDLAQAYP